MKAMLASKWSDKHNSEMFPLMAQPKLDGIRVLVGPDGYLYTRSLKPVRNQELQSLVRNHADVLMGMDAEIIVGDKTAEDCYRRTSSAVMSYENDDIAYATLCIFDKWDMLNTPAFERYKALVSVRHTWPDWCELVKTDLLRNYESLQKYENKRILEGHEGVILRHPERNYKAGRGSPTKGELIKLKRFADMEGVVVNVHEEMHNGNEATVNALGYTEHSGHKENLIGKERLGALELKIDEQKWPSGVVRVGSGFTALQRQSLWLNRQELIGKTVKFKYFEVGVKDAPRFPVFLGFRDVDDMEPTQGKLL